MWLDHTGHNSDRQHGSSTKAWRFDAVGMMRPIEGEADPRSAASTLSFDHPGKARLRTPDNWQQFAAQTVRLAVMSGCIRRWRRMRPRRNSGA